MHGVRVVMNERSGACAGQRDAIEAAFRECGVPCKIFPVTCDLTLEALDVKPGMVLVAAGGDGTVNAVANIVAGTSACMGILALGTLNHFAKDLGLPLDVREAARVIVNGQPRTVDAGEVNDQVFVNNSSLGFYPGMVIEREKLKKAGWNKWISLLVASVRALFRFRQLVVTLTIPGDGPGAQPVCIERKTPFLFVGNNEYTLSGTAAGSRTRVDGGKLHLVLAPGATRWSLLRLSIAALCHRVQQADNFEAFCTEEFTVAPSRHVFRVSFDGELKRMTGEVKYRVRPGLLQVMCPREASKVHEASGPRL